jgi:hypothetical protein
VSFAQRIRSSHRARRRCRSSRSASCPPLLLVAKRVAVPVDVGEPQLGAGVRAFLADDDPDAAGPGGQVQHAGELGDPRAVADLPAGVVGGGPGPGRDLQDGVVDVGGDGHADRVLQPPAWPGEPVQEVMGAAAGIGPDQHPAPHVPGQLGQGQPGGLDVIGGGAPARRSRPGA